MNETAAPLPDEDRLELPPGWAGRRLPRRGGAPASEARLDQKASQTVRDLIDWEKAELLEALARPEHREYADDAAAYIEGEPNAVGAGAVTALLAHSGRRRTNSPLRPDLDAWVLDHGLAFAVCAAIEALAVAAWRYDPSLSSQGVRAYILEPVDFQRMSAIVGQLHDGIALLRAMLAAASDEEYAAVVAAAAAHRDRPVKRVVATLLLPEEREWNDQACLDYAANHSSGYPGNLVLCSARSAEHLATAGISTISGHHINSATLATLIEGVGPESLQVLTRTLRRTSAAAERRLLLSAVAALPSDQAADHLITRLAEPHVFEAAVDFAARFPVRTLRAIARTAAGATPGLLRRMAGIMAAHPASTAAARAMLDRAELAVIDDLVIDSAAVEAAAPEDLPPLLTAPPWKRKRAASRTVVDGLRPPAGRRLAWAPGERELWSAVEHEFYEDAERWIQYVENRPPERWGGMGFAFGPLEAVAPHFQDWKGPDRYPDLSVQRRLLARYGEAAVDPVLAAARDHHEVHEALLPVSDLETARLTADRFLRLKSLRSVAVAWFRRHGADAARLLIPDALGSHKGRRRPAEAALSLLASLHGREDVLAAADHYGETARNAIEEALCADPLEPLPGVRIPKTPAWANPTMLPQVLLKGRERALPPDAVEHLITVLALATPEFPYAGLEVLARTCDRGSLRDFSWALFEQWVSIGAPSKDGWALTQLAHFADDTTVRSLTPLVREWPGQSQHKRAVAGLEVLGAIGSEAALRAIHGVAQKAKFKGIKEKAAEQIEEIAAGLGLGTEQLADRLVPDFGLGDTASLVLDYGPRRFRVGFDEQLKPFVADEEGKPRKSLPKPGVKDHAETAEAAYERFSQLKKDLRTVAADQVRRLERAMIEGRTWT
ncbi:MAG TPA: DUF4132 domain-containing protein, partial [Glycomyces sp.]|nr:DUF4132 domain-containing protein [Glycomyces sp.]